jgi:acyl carrier protein
MTTTEVLSETEATLVRFLVENCEVDVKPEDIQSHWMLFDVGVPDTPTMNMDSLAALELIVCVANEFNVQLDEAPKVVWTSLGTLAEYIDEHRR